MIKIDDEFYIETDSYQYILNRRIINQETSKVTFRQISWHGSLENCIEKVMHIKQRRIAEKDLSLVGALHEMDKINKEMKEILLGIRKKESL